MNDWMMALLIVLFLLPWSAASGIPAFSEEQGDIKIGAVLPLTGEGAFWGDRAQKAMQLAADDINKGGGIGGRHLKIIVEDGKCSGKASVTAFNKLVSSNRVSAVVGEICSSATMAMAPIAQRKKIVLITPCSEGPGITKVGKYIFRTWSPNNFQGKAMAEFAWNWLKVRRVAIVSLINDFAQPISEAFKKRFMELGGKIVIHEEYSSSVSDMKTELLRVKQSKPEAIYMAGYPSDSLIILKQLKNLDIKIPVIGASGIDNIQFYAEAKELADGMFMPTVLDRTTAAFKKRYEKLLGEEWPGVNSCAGVAYDDIKILAEAFRKVGLDSVKVQRFIASIKDMPGVSGKISFDSNRNLRLPLEVKIVKSGRLVDLK